MNGRPISNKKKVQLMVALTILAWATQTLRHQWGFGAELMPTGSNVAAAAAATGGAALPDDAPIAERFLPPSARAVLPSATLELRGEATIYGPEVRLNQLCRWSNADAGAFVPVADLVVARFDGRTPFKTVSLDEVRTLLHDAKVNLALVRFSGPLACTVRRSDAEVDPKTALEQWIDARQGATATAVPTATPAAAIPAAAALPAASPAPASAPADASPVRSLRQAITEDLAVRLALSVEQLQITFNPKDERVLTLSEPQFRFNLDATRARNLGDVEYDVLVVNGGHTQKVPIAALARAWQRQLVLNKPLTARQPIRADDVTEHRVLVDRLSDDLLLTPAQAVGQQTSRDLPPGTVLVARMVEAVPLAKNGQFVTVTLNQGGIRVKTVGRAMEAGSLGQTVKVKNETTGDVYEAVMTGPQEGNIGGASATN